MALNVRVQRDILIPAPTDPNDHSFCWAVNPSYTTPDGLGLIMSTPRWSSSGGDESWRKRRSALQRMVSHDNGAIWQKRGPVIFSDSLESGHQTLAWSHFLDPVTHRLLAIHQETRPGPGDGATLTTLHYGISSDGGATWTPSRQIIHRGAEFNATHWMPGITDQRYIGADQLKFAKLDDGTIVFGLVIIRHKPDFPKEQLFYGVAFLRGRWNDDASDLSWDTGDCVHVASSITPFGPDEPDLVHLGGQRLVTTLRCEGMLEPLGLFTTRQWALSEDGGKTWSQPQLLCYEDGSMVCMPASISAFETDPKTGRIYRFGNILDRPVCDQMPRYPFTMAEFDPNRLCVLKNSVTCIQDLPPGAPANRMYSNFGHYVDRVTNEFVLMMAEKPMINDLDLRSDTIRFRIDVSRA